MFMYDRALLGPLPQTYAPIRAKLCRPPAPNRLLPGTSLESRNRIRPGPIPASNQAALVPELAAVFPPSAAIFTMAAADATSPSPKKQNKLKGKASPARANPTTGVASSPGSAIPVEIDAGAPRTSIFSLSFTRKKKAKPSALAPTVQADTPSVPAPAPAATPAAAASPSKMENESATTVQAHVRMHQAEAAYQDQKLGANAKTDTEAATTEVVPVHLPEPGSVFPLGWVVAPAKPIVVTPIARAEPWWHGPVSCVTIAVKRVICLPVDAP